MLFFVAYEIKIHLNRLHCSVSYASVLNFCFHAPDSYRAVAMWWLILGSSPVHAAPQALCLPPTLHSLSLSSQRIGSYKHLPSFFMPIAFYCRGYFCPRHWTRVAGIITPSLGREEILPRPAYKPEVRLAEAQRTYRLFRMLSHRDLFSDCVLCILPTACFLHVCTLQ